MYVVGRQLLGVAICIAKVATQCYVASLRAKLTVKLEHSPKILRIRIVYRTCLRCVDHFTLLCKHLNRLCLQRIIDILIRIVIKLG